MRGLAKILASVAVMLAAGCDAVPAGRAGGDGRADFRKPGAPVAAAAGPKAAELGRALFHDARLSGDGSRSCATCHKQELGWGDGLPRAAGMSGRPMGLRTPTILNLARAGRMGWDGKFEGVEEVTFGPLSNPENMGSTVPAVLATVASDPAYVDGFAAAFGDGAVTRARIEAAVGAYVRTIESPPSRFDAWLAGDDGALTAAEHRGFDLFRGKAGCSACHSGWAMTDNAFHDVGIGDAEGRGKFFPGSAKLAHAWKTPGLREIGKRAPYMHDGSVATLAAVVDHYDAGGRTVRPSLAAEVKRLGLTPAEKSDLVSFLESLDAGPASPETDVPDRASQTKG